jgi:hypothetical protein
VRAATLGTLAILLCLTGCGVSINTGSGSADSSSTGSTNTPKVVLTTAEGNTPEKFCPAAEHPAELALSCHMGYPIRGLHWANWGEPVSYADGTASVDNCEPNCAEGTNQPFAIELIVSQIEACENGQRRYTKVYWHLIRVRRESGEADLRCPGP